MKFSYLFSTFKSFEHILRGQLSNLGGSVLVGSEPHTDETIKQAAVDWCTGGDAKDAVIAKHGAMKDWDVSAVTNMANLFNGKGDGDGNDIFKTCVLYVEDWDVSSVTDMSYMFNWAEAFNGDVTNFDTSSVTDMSHMFESAHAFNGDLTNFDTSSVTDMSAMFQGASVFNGNGISNWVTYLVHDMSGMFYQAEAFNADISQWDVSDCTNFGNFLPGATSFDNNLCDAGASPSWQSSGYCN